MPELTTSQPLTEATAAPSRVIALYQQPRYCGPSNVQRLLDEHREYLGDQVRLNAFARAVATAVRPGDVVLDLGCGSGVLGLMACRAGAARVYAVDAGGIIQVARAIARNNGVSDRIFFIRGRSTDVNLPEPVDVVVCDQLGPLGFDAGLIQSFEDARRRLLKPGGRLIPAATTTWFAPAESAAMYSTIDWWLTARAGFRFDAFHRHAVNSVHHCDDGKVAFLASGIAGLRFEFRVDGTPFAETRVEWIVHRPGVLHGLAAWFVAELADGVTLTNAPDTADRISRRLAFLPLEHPVHAAVGDRVVAKIQVRPANRLVRWTTTVERASMTLARFDQSTLRGRMLSAEDVANAAASRR